MAFGQPFSDDGFRALLQSQIVPLYEAKGYMHVTFPKITTSPSTDVTGVDVNVTVDEGAEYKLTRVAVFGRSPEESARILKTAKLPGNDGRELRRSEAGCDARAAGIMRQQGFLDARVTTDKKLDEEKKTVELLLVVEPGPSISFGKLTVNGLGLDGENGDSQDVGLETGRFISRGLSRPLV